MEGLAKTFSSSCVDQLKSRYSDAREQDCTDGVPDGLLEGDYGDPLVFVLQKEVQKCQYVLDVAHKDLQDALLVIQGTGIRSTFGPRIQNVIESAFKSTI